MAPSRTFSWCASFVSARWSFDDGDLAAVAAVQGAGDCFCGCCRGLSGLLDAAVLYSVDSASGKLVGGKFQLLHPGDRLVIPPGMPHIFTATQGHTFTYVIFKQKV